MDRPRELKGTPLTREAKRLARAGLLITAIVLAVGSLPVILLWLWSDELEPTAGLGGYGEEVAYPSGEIELAGRLWLPPYQGSHPALVVAHGSGRTTRDAYERLAGELAVNGFALLSYDKRGVGDSGGSYTDIGPGNSDLELGRLADDVLAGIRYLRTRPEIDPDRIGIYAISQGGWIAPLAASRSSDVAFMAIVSGPVVTVGEEIYYSELTGEREAPDVESRDAELSRQLAEWDGARGFDPLPALQAIDLPALWILGQLDRSIPIPETVRALDSLIEAGKPFHYELLRGVGHGMRYVRTGERVEVLSSLYPWLFSVVPVTIH